MFSQRSVCGGGQRVVLCAGRFHVDAIPIGVHKEEIKEREALSDSVAFITY